VSTADGQLAPLEMWAVPRALRGETAANEEYRLRRKDTGETWIGSYSFGPVRDHEGAIVGSVVVGRDITEQKRAEEALRKSETLYRGLFNSMNDGFCIIEMIFDAAGKPADYRFLQINAAFERQTGLHEAAGKRMRELVPTHEEHWFEIYGKIALTGEPAHFLNEAKALNAYYEVSAYRVGEPELRQVAIVFNDISVRLHTEEALKRSMEQLQIFVEHAPAALAMFDLDMRYICASRRWSADYGLGDRDLRGLSHYDIFPEIPERWKEAHRRARAGELVQSEDDSFVRADGSLQRLRWEIHPWHEPSGGIGGIVVFTEDITERKRAEAHIRQLNRVYSVLSDINQTIVREKDSQTMLAAACRIAVDKGQFRMAWIGMINPDTQVLEPVAFSGVVEGYFDQINIDFRESEPDSGPAAHCFHTGEHAICNDIEHELNQPWRGSALQHGYRSMAAFPLLHEGKIIGIFCLYAGELAFFDDDETKLLNEMAMDISFALEVNRHEEQRRQAEKHVRQLNRVYSVLSDINQTIVREKDSQAMLAAACRIAVDKGQFLMAWIGTADSETHALRPIASSGEVGDYLDRLQLDFLDPARSAGPSVQCFLSGKHVICNALEEDPRFAPWRDDALRMGYRSHASFPLKVDAQVAGIFNFYSSELAFFDEDEIRLLDELAMDIGFALEVNRREEDRRKAEEELRWRTAFFEAQVDSASDGVLVVDRQDRKILQNQRMNDMMQIPKEIAEDPDDMRQREYVRSSVRNPDRFIEKVVYLNSHPDEVLNDEVELLNGTIIERYSSPVRDKAGNHYGRIWTFRDITERRQLEEQFRQSQKMEALGQLTGGIAHDFNNLLTVILGCSAFIGEEAKENPRLSKMAKMILDAAQRGADLTHRMLAFARRQPLQPKPVDINRMLANMESILRRTLSADIDLEVIQSGEDCTALVDPPQLENALLNLCMNAWDAMPGGGKLIVETGIATLDSSYAEQNADVTPGKYVLISVSDTGCGISPENLGRVFDPFFTTKEVGKGTGLGLSMVYGFVKQSQGHVKIYSEPGQGTSVKLYLPRADQESEPADQEAILIADLHGSEVILLVEDNAPVREFAKTQLLHLGYQVLEAANGKDALAVLREHNDIDLLFTDVVMPGGLNGRELAHEARQLYPALKVLFTSGYAESAILDMGLLDQHVQLLNKPYSRLQLARRIRGMLAARQSAPEEEGLNG
jgi:PAS domain S-box-containing protein